MAAFSARRRIGSPKAAAAPQTGGVMSLGRGHRGLCGIVVHVGPETRQFGAQPSGAAVPLGAANASGAIAPEEIERRLLEMGFVEGARVEILHEGAIGRDPIGVRLDDTRIALRRREADFVLVRVERMGLGRAGEAADAPIVADAAE